MMMIVIMPVIFVMMGNVVMSAIPLKRIHVQILSFRHVLLLGLIKMNIHVDAPTHLAEKDIVVARTEHVQQVLKDNVKMTKIVPMLNFVIAAFAKKSVIPLLPIRVQIRNIPNAIPALFTMTSIPAVVLKRLVETDMNVIIPESVKQ